MLYLVDTDVLLRLFDRSDPNHGAIRTALKLLRSQGHSLVTTPQNIAEFWNVSTRPSTARGGFGQFVAMTGQRVQASLLEKRLGSPWFTRRFSQELRGNAIDT